MRQISKKTLQLISKARALVLQSSADAAAARESVLDFAETLSPSENAYLKTLADDLGRAVMVAERLDSYLLQKGVDLKPLSSGDGDPQ